MTSNNMINNLSNVAIGTTVSVAANDLTPTIATVIIVLIKEFFSWLKIKKTKKQRNSVEERLQQLEELKNEKINKDGL